MFLIFNVHVNHSFKPGRSAHCETRNLKKYRTMSTASASRLVAVCQMTSTSDRESNFSTCQSLIERSAKHGAKVVFLPEAFDLIGESRAQTLELAEPLDGPFMRRMKQLAKDNNVWLSLGGFHEKGPDHEPNKIQNAHVIVNQEGEIASVYRKLHLFDVEIKGSVRLKESDYTIAGDHIVEPVESPVGKIGLGICYDMRFPEFSLALSRSGADIITYPSAFTQTTGMAHWEAILRARAIESQCYVIAAAQTGKHNSKRSSYGHAMIVDPWGRIVASCSEGTNLVLAEIDLDYIAKIRTEMPVFQHRRPEIYGSIPDMRELNLANINSQEFYQFGQVEIKSSQIFYKSAFSMAFVNKKPVVPGHVLISPIRPVKRVQELNSMEISDLFATAQRVQKVVEKEFNANSSTLTIQDGIDAGQSIFHVHVHILPRRPNDFKRNDDVYFELQDHDKSEKYKFRNEDEMAKEAEILRKYFL